MAYDRPGKVSLVYFRQETEPMVREAKRVAAEQQRSFSQTVVDGLRLWLEQQAAEQQ